MITKDNLWAVVVWYHPTEEQKANIETYRPFVHQVVVVDNTENNVGIAAALNRGVQECIAGGAEWILTMDQDSHFNDNDNDNAVGDRGDNENAYSLRQYIAAANGFDDIAHVGLFSPIQNYNDKMPRTSGPYDDMVAVMTSGNIISAEAYRRSAGFREEFFIDLVDNEYCLQMHRLGLRVVRVNSTLLVHSLGDELYHVRLFGIWKKEVISHKPFRYYYMVRNNLQTQRMYPEHKHFHSKRLCRIVKRVILYDRVNKLAKLRMIWRGYRDFRRGIFGPMKQ